MVPSISSPTHNVSDHTLKLYEVPATTEIGEVRVIEIHSPEVVKLVRSTDLDPPG